MVAASCLVMHLAVSLGFSLHLLNPFSSFDDARVFVLLSIYLYDILILIHFMHAGKRTLLFCDPIGFSWAIH